MKDYRGLFQGTLFTIPSESQPLILREKATTSGEKNKSLTYLPTPVSSGVPGPAVSGQKSLLWQP